MMCPVQQGQWHKFLSKVNQLWLEANFPFLLLNNNYYCVVYVLIFFIKHQHAITVTFVIHGATDSGH